MVGQARTNRWITILGGVSGLVLFVRLLQVLPCCQTPQLDEVLRTHACSSGLDPCPHYDDCAPR
jgi:hypothetical protein